jgi:transcription termination factor Rho
LNSLICEYCDDSIEVDPTTYMDQFEESTNLVDMIQTDTMMERDRRQKNEDEEMMDTGLLDSVEDGFGIEAENKSEKKTRSKKKSTPKSVLMKQVPIEAHFSTESVDELVKQLIAERYQLLRDGNSSFSQLPRFDFFISTCLIHPFICSLERLTRVWERQVRKISQSLWRNC